VVRVPFDVVLNEGSHVSHAAACCHDEKFCVPAVDCDATCIFWATSHSLSTSDDLKYDADFVVSSN
jgi:hypothetical protein